MTAFDEIASLSGEPDRMIDRVAQEFVARGELHRLFDLRLAQKRLALNIAIDGSQGIDDVAEPLRTQLESAYLDACREAGQLLLEAGRYREAWTYLRPAGDKQLMRSRLARVVPNDEQADELIEMALYEAVDPERGFAWLLGRNGTCNAITALDSLQHQLTTDEFSACAASLVRHVYRELRGNLRGHLQKTEGVEKAELSVSELTAQYPSLLADGSYHLDPSHLASTVRFARMLTDPSLLQLAVELTDYGAKLPDDLQYPGESPFEQLYARHRLFFLALLGKNVEQAVDYFRQRASQQAEPGVTTAIETYLVLLDSVGMPDEAIRAYDELASPEGPLSRHAPRLIDLAKRAGDWSVYEEICRKRDDLLGLVLGRMVDSTSRDPT